MTVEQVSKNENLGRDAVQSIFHKVAQLKKRLGKPKRLSLDEFSRRKGQGNLATIVTDLDKALFKKWLISAKVLLGSAADSVDDHLTEIANYFHQRTTSGVTEGINTRIKLILRQSYGFRSFDAMKEKLLACLSPEVRESPSIGFLPPLRDRIESALGGLAFLRSPVMKLLSLKSVDDRHCYQKCIS